MTTFSIKLLYLSLLAGFGSMAFNQNPIKVLGKWQAVEDEKVVVLIYQAKDGLYYGKAMGKSDKSVKQGQLIFQKCRYDSKTASLKGTMHPPDKPLALDVTIQSEENGQLKVTAQKFFMSKTLYFLRINE